MDAPRPPDSRLPIALVAVALVVFAVAAVLVGGGLRAGNPAGEPGGDGLLAVTDADGGLAATDARGRTVAAFDIPGVTFQFPAWSPDGRRIAAVGAGRDGGGVYVFTIRGADDARADAEPDVLYTSREQPPFYLSWAPDGSRVSFLTTEAEGIALRVAPADAGSPATIVREGAPFYWDWVDPDRVLVHVGTDGPEAFIGEVGLDGVSLEPEPIAAGLFRAPGVSRDAEHRAYVASAAGAGQRIVIETRGATDRREIPVHGTAAFGFDSTAAWLAFIAAAGPDVEPTILPLGPLRLVETASGEIRTLIDGLVVGFFWSPDGTTIAALSLIDPEGPAVDEVAVLDRPGIALHLAFVDVTSGTIRSERTVRVTDTFAFQVLPYFDQYALSHRFWSPDGTALALPIASHDAGDRLTVFPAGGADPWQVGAATTGFWTP